MVELSGKISRKTRREYSNQAMSASKSYGIVIGIDDKFESRMIKILKRNRKEIKKLKNHPDFDGIYAGMVLKNTSLILDYLEYAHDEEMIWYKHSEKYGKNSYPVLCSNVIFFPSIWVQDVLDFNEKLNIESRFTAIF